jgi:acylphosphatase
MSKNSQRITVRYEGCVQGVGFRYTAVSLAQDFKVSGWVKNEFDGSVSLVAEGAEDQLMELLQAISRSNLGRYITNELVRRSTATGEFTGFDVRH